MSRHRSVRNIKLEEHEVDIEDDEQEEVDVPPSRSEARHRYHGRGSQVFQFVDQAFAGNRTPSPPPVEVHDYDAGYYIGDDYDDYDYDDDYDDYVGGTSSKMSSKQSNKSQATKQQSSKQKQSKSEPPQSAAVTRLKDEEYGACVPRSSSKSPTNSRASTPIRGRLNPPSQGSMPGSPRPQRPKNRQRPASAQMKEQVTLVVVGHVDAGKSTMMGHVLRQLGAVTDRQMNKMKTESQKLGKASFAYAWVLDETSDERERGCFLFINVSQSQTGVTMDIATRHFETAHRYITLLDAPGHRDFIPNMITGASQADACLLVVNATRGEFESGFDQGGQTREHALLVRALGVSNVIIAVNKLDTVDWSKERYEEIQTTLKQFLTKTVGFASNTMRFVPVSGLLGVNLTKPPSADCPLAKWYNGDGANTLLDLLDTLPVPARDDTLPLRFTVSSVYKGGQNTAGQNVSGALTLCGAVLQGSIAVNDRVLIQPSNTPATVKQIALDSQEAVDDTTTNFDEENYFAANTSIQAKETTIAFTGDTCTLVLADAELEGATFTIDAGCVICHPDDRAIAPLSTLKLKIMTFDLQVPLIKGQPVDVHAHNAHISGHVTKLLTVLDRRTGEVVQKKPRFLLKHSTGEIELRLNSYLCVEAGCRALSRVTLRSKGKTIAAGLLAAE